MQMRRDWRLLCKVIQGQPLKQNVLDTQRWNERGPNLWLCQNRRGCAMLTLQLEVCRNVRPEKKKKKNNAATVLNIAAITSKHPLTGNLGVKVQEGL